MEDAEAKARTAKQAETAPEAWAWVDRAILTEHILAALGNGVKGTRKQMLESDRQSLSTDDPPERQGASQGQRRGGGSRPSTHRKLRCTGRNLPERIYGNLAKKELPPAISASPKGQCLM